MIAEISGLSPSIFIYHNIIIIEFDGQHHFDEIYFNNHNSTKLHDAIKNQYCKSHNIGILRIPYWNGNNIENIIAEKLNL